MSESTATQLPPVAGSTTPLSPVVALRSTTPIKDALLEFFQEDNGGMSMTRLIAFGVSVNTCGVIDYAVYHAKDGVIPDLPSGVVMFVAGALALKLGQKFGEQKGQL